MAFDISRYTFNALNDYLGVVMQQGRVHLDSDWNELLAEFTRRIHAGTLDIIGLSGVPSTTPGAFQINVTPPDSAGNQHVTIGVGRIYVDGILAENHGSAIDYTGQPYVRGATLPALGTGPYLVYLDVWRRDVSFLQDPSLVDQAVGVDTTGRLQTVWQVKLLDVSAVVVAGGFAGSTPDAAISSPVWQTLIQGSPSLLTNGTTGAYAGQENQLYRVEIHQGGVPAASSASLPVTYAPGLATFKWSRENASVATTVTAITAVTNSLNNQASQLTVASLGRDQALGFTPGDWIEITDDYLELNGTSAQAGGSAQAGSASSTQPGELHQIVSINVAALTITLDTPVTAATFPLINGLTIPARHTRIRRWDQTASVYLSDGQTAWATSGSEGIPVPPPGTSLILENGVTVAFDLNVSTGFFQTGDYWTFAARTADLSVAPLTRAAPAGIGHHICRLAILTLTGTPGAMDCRNVFRSLSNPAIHVLNVSPLSGAQLPPSGGTLSVQDLSKGLNIFFDSQIDPGIITAAIGPICLITIQLPATAGGWLNPVILEGSVTVPATQPRSITWTPVSAMQSALLPFVSPTNSVLARLTLKGDSIWAPNGPPPYLNGAALPDGRVYADFDMWFWINSQPPVALSASSLNFGDQLVGAKSAVQPVTLTNDSGGELTFTSTSFTLAGTNPADFSVTNTCGTGIASGVSCTVSVVFSPTSVSPLQPTRTATLSIAGSIGTPSSPITLPPITLTGTALAPWLSPTVSSLNFSSTIVGTTSTLTVTLTNTGTASLSISQISISGTPLAPAVAGLANVPPPPPPASTSAPGDFRQTSVPSGGGTLQPNQVYNVTVSFTPSATGVRTAYLNITHNAAGLLNSILLTGVGILRTKSGLKDAADTHPAVIGSKAPTGNLFGTALKSFITPEERPSINPPTPYPSVTAKPKNPPQPLTI
jgi:hypothetical protein